MALTLPSSPGKLTRTHRLASEPIGISLVTVHPGTVSYGWHESIIRTLAEQTFTYHLISVHSGVLIAGARNHSIERFLEDTEDDYFLSVDSDIEWEPEVIEHLVNDEVPIVSAVYVGNTYGGDMFPVFNVIDAETGKGRKATFDDLPEADVVIPVHGVGMGFCLIHRSVLEDLGTRTLWPFEEIIYQGQATGEDITFSIRAASKGYESYVDTGVRVGHRKAVVL